MSVLIIDDEGGLRRALCAFLEDMDFDVLDAENGLRGLELLREYLDRVEAVIVDLNMPVMDGYAFIQHAVQEAPETPIIVLSGVGVVDDALRAMRLGAWDFITKPVHSMDILEHTLRKVLDRARLIRENRAYKENLEKLVRERTAELETTRRQVMQRLSRAAEFKDNETGNHVVRVGEISALVARAMGLPETEREMLRECAPLHDVGKIGIPDEILLKPGKLDSAEWKVMQLHCLYGCEILGPLISKEEALRSCSDPTAIPSGDNELLKMARVLAMFHHEHWDGTGYPFGLKGEAIPLVARIVSVVDVFDALASERPYKAAYPETQCLDTIRRGAGRQFDPKVVEAFFLVLDDIRAVQAMWRD